MESKEGSSSICPAVTIQSNKCPAPGTIIFATQSQSLVGVERESKSYSTFGKGSIAFIIGFKLGKLSTGMDLVVRKRSIKDGKVIYDDQSEV